MLKQAWAVFLVELRGYVTSSMSNRVSNKTKTSKAFGALGKFLVIALVFAYLFVMMLSWYYTMVQAGFAYEIPFMAALITTAFIVLQQFNVAGQFILDRSHYERLLSMPIDRKIIVAIRFCTMCIPCYLYSALAYSSAATVLIMTNALSDALIGCVAGFFFAPIAPMLLALLVTVIIYGIRRLLHGSTMLVNILLILVVAVPGALLYFGVVFHIIDLLAPESVALMHQVFFFFTPLNDVSAGSLPALLLFIGANILVLAVGIGLFASCFDGLTMLSRTDDVQDNSFSFAKHADGATDAQDGASKAKSVVGALLHKEFQFLVETPTYLANYGLLYFLQVFFIIGGGIAVGFGLLPPEADEIMATPIVRLAPIFLIGILGFAPMTTCTYSLEGNSWWILQTAAVPAKTVALAKLLFSLIPAVTLSVLALVASVVFLNLSFETIICIGMVSLSILFLCIILHMYIDMKKPDFSWTATNNMRAALKGKSTTPAVVFLGYALIFLQLITQMMIEGGVWFIVVSLLQAVVCFGIAYAIWRLITRIELADIC